MEVASISDNKTFSFLQRYMHNRTERLATKMF